MLQHNIDASKKKDCYDNYRYIYRVTENKKTDIIKYVIDAEIKKKKKEKEKEKEEEENKKEKKNKKKNVKKNEENFVFLNIDMINSWIEYINTNEKMIDIIYNYYFRDDIIYNYDF